MTDKQFIAIGDAFRFTRPYVADVDDTRYKDQTIAQYRQWLEDVGVVAKQIASVAPNFNMVRWIDYVHGFVDKHGRKVRVEYEVVVGNIGRVYAGKDKALANAEYEHYINLSQLPVGRASGENVALMEDGVLVVEYQGDHRENR